MVDICPQHQVHYVHQTSDINVARNDTYKSGMLNILERVEQIFTGPLNPEQEISVGLFKLRIPAFPIEVVREAILNAVTHRNYLDSSEVLIRHTKRELTITSPGGFIGGITLDNILRHEPVSRNKTLSEIFEKLRLVERAGIGRRRIFIPMLSYGKRIPKYETSGERVTLHLYDGSFDERMAALVVKWKQKGFEIDLDSLLILSYLKENPFINSSMAASLLQLQRESAKSILDRFSDTKSGILERKGHTGAATYQLAKGVAKDLLGKTAYTKRKGLNPIRYAEIVREYVTDHDSITPAECRELLQLGDSQSARVEVSRYLRKWSSENGFLFEEGKPPGNKYFLKK